MAGTPIRLRKAAQEFNVGTSTIIEFLEKKGYVLEDNPNTKISEELYGLLIVAFKKDKETKLGAEKINFGNAKHQTITLEDKPKKEIEEEIKWEKPLQIDHLRIRDATLPKDILLTASTDNSKTNIKETKDFETKKPVVLGKIELETPKPPKTKKKSVTQKEEIQQGTIMVQKSETIASEAITPTDIQEKQEEQTLIVSTQEYFETKEEPKKPEKAKIDMPHLGVTIVGSIELEQKVSKNKPTKTSTENKKRNKHKEYLKSRDSNQHKEETPSSPQQVKLLNKAEQSTVEHPKEESSKNVMRLHAPRIKVPTVIATIDLSQFDRSAKPVKAKKGERVASSSDEFPTKDFKKGKKPHPHPNTANKPVKPVHPVHPVRSVQPGNQGGFQRDNKFFKKKFPKTEVKVAPTEEEIKKQITDTLNKLTSPKSTSSKHRKEKREGIREKQAIEARRAEAEKNILKVTEFLTANELAGMMDVSVTEVIKKCMEIGLFVSINQRLDAETIVFISDEFGFQVSFIDAEDQDVTQEEDIDKPEDLQMRHPVVTVMGHVDHGKTKLLDYIRHANVVAGEAGGITQHIGAYSVELDDGRKITFLDTPGHEAFTAMRARGTKITDVVIIVIAADDDVMPQTKEAINHAQAANVPIVFAINKIDKSNADADKIKKQLAEMNILIEEWGGKYQCQEISAKQGTNIDLLLEKVLLEAEMLELKANPNRVAKGSVIESKLEPGRGYVASLMVQNGTLYKGDIVLAGQYYGRIKALFNERYQAIDSVPPATPALILGLNGAPQAGDNFSVMEEEREARILATKRQQLQREIGLRTQKHITLDDIGRHIAKGSFKELNIIVKGDVDGSVEALADSLLKLSTEEVKVNVIHKSVGAIIESDVMLASASNAIIIGFQVRPSGNARKLAELEQIDIRIYSVIYNAIGEIKSAIEGMLSPEIKEEINCNVEVREIFKIHKVGTIAGCLVLDGVITRDTKVRIIRDGIVVYTGTLGSLKRFKDDVKEVRSGIECGLNINNFNDMKVGDIIEGYKEIEIKRVLN